MEEGKLPKPVWPKEEVEFEETGRGASEVDVKSPARLVECDIFPEPVGPTKEVVFDDVAYGACEVDGGKLLRPVDPTNKVEFEVMGYGANEVDVGSPPARLVGDDISPEPVGPT